jgi:integrase
VFLPEESKGEEWPRIVCLSDEALDLTRRLMLEHPSGPLFRNSDGCPWTTDAVNCAFVRAQITLGMSQLKARGLLPPRVPRLRGPARRDPERSADHDRLVADRRREVLRLAKEHGKKHCLYALRHSWATHALSRGVDALTVAILLGHRDPATLAKTYQHLTQNPGYLQEAARRVRA